MKLGQKQKLLSILIILLCNMIVTSIKRVSSKRKSHKRRNQKRKSTPSTSSSPEKSVFVKIKEVLTDPINILKFSIGVLASFFSFFEDLYKILDTLSGIVDTCSDIASKLYNLVSGNDSESGTKSSSETESGIIKSKSELDKGEDEDEVKSEKAVVQKNKMILDFEGLSTPEEKKKYCEKVQRENMNLLCSIDEDSDEGIITSCFEYFPRLASKKLVTYKFGKIVKEKLDCHNILLFPEKLQEKVKKDYGSIANYIEICQYLKTMDCNKFNPNTSAVWKFANKAYSYFSLANGIKNCIMKVVETNDDVKKLLNKFMIDIALLAFGVVANIFSLGIWGVIKGAYYLIKTGLDLANKIWKFFTKDIPFRLGKLVGQGIMVIKSLIVGRKLKLVRKRILKKK